MEDLAEIECFTEIASIYVRAGMPVRRAWAAANAWIDEHEPGEMPECIPYPRAAAAKPMPPPRTLGLLATPPERRTEPPRDVEHLVPREKPVDLDAEEVGVDEPLLFEHEIPPPPAPRAPQAAPEQGPPRRLRVRGSAPSSGAASGVVHRDVKPEKETRMIKDDILEALGALGTANAREIADRVKKHPSQISTELKKLLGEGVVDRMGPSGAFTWKLGSGKSTEGEAPPPVAAKKTRTMADVAKKAAKRAPKPKANGHATVNIFAAEASGSTGAVNAALQALAAAFKSEFEQKMAAIEVLAGGPKK